jgi:hypothetical protein
LNKVGGQTFADVTETAINTTAILTGISRLPKSPFPSPTSYSGAFPEELTTAPIKGGSYEAVGAANLGGDVHHIPANSTTALARELGPAIHMETLDRAKTASFAGSRAANAYRFFRHGYYDRV